MSQRSRDVPAIINNNCIQAVTWLPYAATPVDNDKADVICTSGPEC